MNKRLWQVTGILVTVAAIGAAVALATAPAVDAGRAVVAGTTGNSPATIVGTVVITPVGTGVATPLPPPSRPAVMATYRFPQDNIVVSGRGFTPFGKADVFVLEGSGLRAQDAVRVSAQGTFVDGSAAYCDFRSHAITAYDEGSGQWSYQFVLGGNCPVAGQ